MARPQSLEPGVASGLIEPVLLALALVPRGLKFQSLPARHWPNRLVQQVLQQALVVRPE
jgi:hypothetical protein